MARRVKHQEKLICLTKTQKKIKFNVMYWNILGKHTHSSGLKMCSDFVILNYSAINFCVSDP